MPTVEVIPIADEQLEKDILDALAPVGITRVPDIFKALWHDPPAVRKFLEQYCSYAEFFSLELIEAVGLAMATANSCPYFISFRSATLKNIGFPDARLGKLVEMIGFFSQANALATGLQLTPDIRPS